jgi:hypothetical protein
MKTVLEYSARVVQEGGRRCKKSTLNDLVHLTSLRIPLMNPPTVCAVSCQTKFKYLYLPTPLSRLRGPRKKKIKGKNTRFLAVI